MSDLTDERLSVILHNGRSEIEPGDLRRMIDEIRRHRTEADRLVTIADEAFGLGAVESVDETLSRLERGINAQHMRNSELRARVEASERIVAGMTKARDEMLGAQALDEERVRKIVLGILFDLLPGDAKVDLADAIANRAARQLAGAAVMANALRGELICLRNGMSFEVDHPEVKKWHDRIDRLLATVRP